MKPPKSCNSSRNNKESFFRSVGPIYKLNTLDELLSGITGVNVWGLVNTSQTPNYQIISTTQSPDWNEVA